MVKWIAGVLR
jgi:hypothetical protein